MTQLSASGLKRWVECPASSVLPRVSEETSEAAERGTDIHDFLDRCTSMSKEDALIGVPDEHRDLCWSIDIKSILKDRQSIRTEVAYALDPVKREARLLGHHLGRKYSVSESEFPGSEDVIATVDDILEVTDYKTGEYVGPAQSNYQLLFFAACLYLLEGASEVKGRIVYILDDGDFSVDEASFTAFDIEEYLDTLAAGVKRYEQTLLDYAAGNVQVKTGDWCRYCAAMASCPAYTSLARRLVPELQQIEDMITAMTPEQAGQAWVMKKQIGTIYEKVDDALKSYAKTYGIRLPNGKVVGPSSFRKSFFSQDEAIKLLTELGASKDQIASCYRSKRIETVRERNKKG